MGLRSLSPAGLMVESFRVMRAELISDGQGGRVQNPMATELGRVRGRMIESTTTREVFANQDRQVRAGTIWCVDTLGISPSTDHLIDRGGARWAVQGVIPRGQNLREVTVAEVR